MKRWSWLVLAVSLVSCHTPAPIAAKAVLGPAAPVATKTTPAPAPRASVPVGDKSPVGIISVALAASRGADGVATVTELGATDTQALLARLEPLPDLTAASAATPSVRPRSAPPPRPGTVVPIAFEAPTGRAVDDKPAVPRKVTTPLAPPSLPEGEAAAEASIRIRFAEPMVAVAAVGTVTNPPAELAPSVPGHWRWLDTRVLEFDPDAKRLPQATDFAIRVPANVKALSGAELKEAVSATLSTPPVMVKGVYPPMARPDSALAIRFDQDVDPDAVVAKLAVVDGVHRTKIAMHRVDLAEANRRWAKNPSLAHDDPALVLGPHYVLVAPDAAWPAGAILDVALDAGAPSREGPRVSKDKSFARFDVVRPFRLGGVTCDDVDAAKLAGAVCPAARLAFLQMSNTIDPSTYHADRVQIAGRPFEDNYLSGTNVLFAVPDEPGRGFTVDVGDGLADIFGQPFEGPHHASFVAGPERYDAALNGPAGLLVLDPRFTIPQWVLNVGAVDAVQVELYKVEPKDYFAYEQFEARTIKTPPGTKISSTRIAVGKKTGAVVRVDLRPALSDAGTGHIVAVARTGSLRIEAWLQVTKLGITARVDGEHVNAWVNDITPRSFRAPVAGVTTSILVERDATHAEPSTTDRDGHAVGELPASPPPPRPGQDRPRALLVATSGSDSTFTAMSPYEHSVRQEQLRWYVTDDRFTYKPGETVYVKGWVRSTDNGVNPKLAVPAAGDTLSYALIDARGNQIATGGVKLTDEGGFDLSVALPPNANLGTAAFRLTTRGFAYQHPISVQEFRTPSFSVMLNDDVTHAGATPLIVGESIEMSAEARYYAGGGLAGSHLDWDASLAVASYQPPGWDLYAFTPPEGDGANRTSVHRDATLSGASTASAVFAIPALPLHRPSVLSVDATVADVDREHIRASSRDILVHPSAYYVGLRLKKSDQLLAVVTDIDGHPVAGVPIAITLVGIPNSERWRRDASEKDIQTCNVTSAAEPVPCEWHEKSWELSYVATAKIADARGRANATAYPIPWWPRGDGKDLAIVADRSTYRPGDVAKLDVRSKVFPATAIVTFARNGVVSQKRVELAGASTPVELPIEESMLEDFHVQVDRISDSPNKLGGSTEPLPEVVSAEAHLRVDLDSARLVMTARASEALVEPGARATFTVEVRHDDKPVANAEVALMVVDEAVLALSNGKHADPLKAFYRDVPAGTSEMSSIPLVRDQGNELDGEPGVSTFALSMSGFGVGGGGTGWGTIGTGRYGTIGHGSGTGVVASRKDFRANAAFAPTLRTDENGRATLTVTMPDSLTRFRVVALAADGPYHFGKAEGTIVTQRKINARTIAPRFLSQGDRFALPVIVQNLDTVERTVDVAVRAGNLAAAGGQGKRVVLPPGQRTEVRFDFDTRALGRAVVQTIVVAGDQADASNVELPVYAPATTESFAAYGTVDNDAQFEQLAVPADIFRDVGGVELEVSSTQLQSLTDAYWYLYAYPYECAEQRSARMIATMAMYEILDAFAVPGRPTRDEIRAQRERDLYKLETSQAADGGWGYWPESPTDPYVTMQVLTAIGTWKDAPQNVRKAVAYVNKRIDEQQAKLDAATRVTAEHRLDRGEMPFVVDLEAAGLASLASVGVDVKAKAERLHASAMALRAYPVDAKARLLAIVAGDPAHAAMRKQLLADLLAVTEETASSATVTTEYAEAERLLLVSKLKTSALALDAMIKEKPDLAVIAKLARGVLDGRRHGRWTSTQDNLVAIRALRRYFDVYEKTTPDFTGKVWIGSAAYTEKAFAGHTNERGEAHLDWSALAPGTTSDVALVKDGPGRMYYRIGITYAPKKIDLPALDAGFLVRRTYAAIDDPSDVVKRADGTVVVKLGARVRVIVEAINSTKRYNVAIVDPLPAGFETVNESLATSERAAPVTGDDYWAHRATRDDRTEAFAMSLDEGSHQMSYTVRAATPGTFLAAPAKAEEMYAPETFGRSAGGAIVIE